MKWIRLGMLLLLAGSLFGVLLQGNTQVPRVLAQASTDTFTITPSPTNNLTITSTPVAPAHMVISEFATRGPKGDGDEFIELYNPTGASINIGGWILRRSFGCSTEIANLAVIPYNVILLAGQHYLLTSSTNNSISGGDQSFTAAMADNGGLALLTNTGQIVDQVGMCISTQYREGTNLNPLSGSASQSYERRPGGDTACYDTNNNAGDFVLISPPRPQNKSFPPARCSGVPAWTPTFTPTTTNTRTPIFTATTIPGAVVINEFLPHAKSDWNGDGTVNVGDEYIELMNMGVNSINIKNWKLDNGPNTTSFSLPNLILLSHEIVVFYHADTGIPISDGGGTVRLVKADGHTADINNYPPVEAADVTWCRLPDGNGGWGFVCKPTPGLPNVRNEENGPTATPTSAGEAPPQCQWADSLPAEVIPTECGGMGGGVWYASPQNEYWLPIQQKWNVFIE